MEHHDEELKKEFQIERMALFSDAVFAIAMTLLIIEVKVPEGLGEAHHGVTDADVLNYLSALIPKFIGFVVSFLVIAMYWVNHHLLFGFLYNYNKKLLWANLYFMLAIVIMPFSSGFYSEFFLSGLITPLSFYVLNISFAGLMNLRLWYIVGNPVNNLSNIHQKGYLVKYYKTRALVAPAFFLLSFVLAFVNIRLAYICPLATPIFIVFVKRYYKKRSPVLFHKEIELD